MSRKIVIIGAGNIGSTIATQIAKDTNNICVLHDVVDSQFTDLRQPEPLLITRLPDFEEPWIDPKEPIVNYKKHEETCAKNRKKRKKRKRR
jgi:3-hydroxyacyl-CoA dehydrogenase